MTARILPQLTAERLREVLHYDKTTGVFRWKINCHPVKAGDIAGCQTACGYRQIKIDKRIYRSHRLAWLYVTGEWPLSMLDHRNGDRSNNEFDNLRECNGTQNNGNIGKRSFNKSGFKGVYRNGKWSTWVATIGLKKRVLFLGCHATPEAAAMAYDAAAIAQYGEFAVTNKMLGLLS